MHCGSHRNLITLESAKGWLENHIAGGTKQNLSVADQHEVQ